MILIERRILVKIAGNVILVCFVVSADSLWKGEKLTGGFCTEATSLQRVCEFDPQGLANLS